MNLTPSEIATVNFELAKVICPVHHKPVVVDFSINKVNYEECCEEVGKLCENMVVEAVASIELDKVIKDMGF